MTEEREPLLKTLERLGLADKETETRRTFKRVRPVRSIVVDEDDTVRLENGAISGHMNRVPIQNLVNLIEAMRVPQISGDFLPRGCRFISESQYAIMFVIEVEPGLRSIQTTRRVRPMELSMPWQYFMVQFGRRAKAFNLTSTKIYWSNHRVVDRNSLVSFARLPNINMENGLVCLGTTAPDTGMSPARRAESLVADFFSPESRFNSDYGWNLPNGYRSFAPWIAASKNDPLAWVKWKDWKNPRVRKYPIGMLIPPQQRSYPITFDEVWGLLSSEIPPLW